MKLKKLLTGLSGIVFGMFLIFSCKDGASGSTLAKSVKFVESMGGGGTNGSHS